MSISKILADYCPSPSKEREIGETIANMGQSVLLVAAACMGIFFGGAYSRAISELKGRVHPPILVSAEKVCGRLAKIGIIAGVALCVLGEFIVWHSATRPRT